MKQRGPKQGKTIKCRGDKGVGKCMMKNRQKGKICRRKRQQEKNSDSPNVQN